MGYRTIKDRKKESPDWSKESNGMVAAVIEHITGKNCPDIETKPRINLEEVLNRRDILLIEDSPTMKDFYRMILENYQFSVVTAEEENSSIDIASRKTPKLILIDNGGTESEALKMAKELKKNRSTSRIPVLMMLPIDIFKQAKNKIQPHVDLCIPKTFTPSILVQSVQSLITS